MMNFAENDTLARIIAGIETTPQTIDEVKTSLKDRGYNPDSDLASFKCQLARMLTRYTWREEAIAKQNAFIAKSAAMCSWATRKAEDIDAAFQKLLSGGFGKEPQAKIAMAFRNLETITREDKAAILDGLELLDDNKPTQTSHSDG